MQQLDKLPLIGPREIYNQLSENVFGQHEAKVALSAAASKHLALSKLAPLSRRPSHILLLGPTGSGKSHMVESLAETLKIPAIFVDATSLTEAGYRGREIDSMFEELIQAAGGDVSRAESGIIFIDEIDKIRTRQGTERDIRGEGVQYSLLKILDGGDRVLSSEGVSRSSQNRVRTISTRGIQFIFAGAFSFVDGGADAIASDSRILTRHGFIPELLGRLSIIISLGQFDRRSVAELIQQRFGELMSDYDLMFRRSGYEIEISQEASDYLARAVIESGMGIRYVRHRLESLLLRSLHDVWADAADHQAVVATIVVGENDLELTYPVAAPQRAEWKKGKTGAII